MSNGIKLPKTINDFIEKIRSNKKIQYAIIAVLLVVVLLVFFLGFNTNTEQKVVAGDSISAYVSNLESRLSSTLSKVNGAGKVAVVITVESGMETVLAMKTTIKETSSGTETETSPITINGKTVVVKEMYPKIVGVLIVAEGAKNIAIMNKLQQATISLLDINLDQIEILTMN